jgi:hypothetical protein
MVTFANAKAEASYREALELVGNLVGFDLRNAPAHILLAYAARVTAAKSMHAHIADTNARYTQITRDMMAWLVAAYPTAKRHTIN